MIFAIYGNGEYVSKPFDFLYIFLIFMAAKTPKKIIKKTTTTPKSTTKKRNKAVKKEENYSIIAGILAGLIILLGG